MAEKYYAVKRGVKTGIFRTWQECSASVKGYSGAIYKSFQTKEEAEAFLLGGADALRKKESVEERAEKTKGQSTWRAESKKAEPEGDTVWEEEGWVRIYVDGSYHAKTGEFSYGMVVLNGQTEETYCKSFRDEALSSMHNVAGEIKGAEAAMRYALEHGIDKIVIYHDYEGIARWCLGEWKTNKEGTRAYKAFYDEVKDRVSIRFVKVAGHSNDKYNDMADELAKKALGIVGRKSEN